MVSASPDPTAAASASLMRSSSSISVSVMWSVAAAASSLAMVQPEDVLDVLAGERQHHVTAVRFQLHHALAAQLQQGLAHRGDADAELGRGLVEPDEGARPQRAGHDRGPQVPRDLVGQLGPAQRPPAPRLHGHRCVHGACQGFQWLGGTGFTF